MRVLVVTVVHHPLDARIHRRQIGALLHAGASVTYAAPWQATGTPMPTDGQISPRDLPRSVGRRRWRSVRAAHDLVADEGPHHDLVLVHDPDLLPSVLLLRRRLPPVVWDVHEDTAAALVDRPWVPAALRTPLRVATRRLERAAEDRLHLLLAEASYRARFRCSHPVVPNVPAVPSHEVLRPGNDRVVYVGRLSRSRGLDTMIELGRRLGPRGVRVELFGSPDPDVAGMVSDAHRRRWVTWHGFVPNAEALPRIEGAMAGLALLDDEPNFRGAMPTKVLEYLAHGVPVVATPLPETARVLQAARGGLLVPFADVDAAEEALVTLRADQGQREELAARGRRHVASHLSWDVEGPQYVEILRRWVA